MRKLFFFIFSFLLVLVVLPSVNANSIGTNSYYINVGYWEEIDFIEKNNLRVSIGLEIFLKSELFEKNITDFIFIVEPREGGHPWKVISNFNFDICEGSRSGHNYDEIPIDCKTRLKYKESIDEHGNHYFNISLNENISKNDYLVAKIDYTILDFLDKNDDKLIILSTDCYGDPGDRCPSYTSINKYINLPTYAALRSYPEDTVLKRADSTGRLIVKLTNFKHYQTASHSTYESKAILFTDLKKIRNREYLHLGIAIVATLFISFVAAFIITYKIKVKPKYYKKLDEETHIKFNKLKGNINSIKTSLNQTIKDKFDKINNKLNSQTELIKNFSKELNQNLKKIENKIKPTKRKQKK